ncbi:MAG: aspartyl-tRNA(Asn)/glutamyl-tRNA(Gln) amidotransferase subunit [Gaiellales bacterium]|nr:aspartyl-tRNA(Asn)/glutamyl-tRNA(Gln) amidotransferase subunit [Gaiellales bacterium]
MPAWGAQGARVTACAVTSRAVSAREVVADVLARIEAQDGDLQAFTAVDAALALRAADEVDRRVASGEQLALAGVPVGVKELVAVAGLPQSYGTDAMPRTVAAQDAECVRRLRAAGAIPVGVTRTSELAWRDDTPPTRNPLDAALSCGGSSGGSAAAVAAGLVPLALGTDTGGSIRLPAALCGCAGHKPTFGSVPRGGVLLISPSLDHVGPLGRTVDDLRLALAALTGAPSPPPAPMPDATGLRVGVPQDLAELAADPALLRALTTLCEQLQDIAGAELVAIDLPSFSTGYGVVDSISLAEGAQILGGALAAPRGALSEESRAELEAAPALGSDRVARAREDQRALVSQTERLFADYRLAGIIVPALPLPAPRRGAPRGAQRLNSLLPLADVTGQPACVLPLQRRPSPLAVQLLGRPGRDDELLALAAIAEALTGELSLA